MFQRALKKNTKTMPAPKGFLSLVPAVKLLGQSQRFQLMTKIKDSLALDDVLFEQTTHRLIHQLSDYCQQIPETSNGYYAMPGGLLDHALNRTEAATHLARELMMQESQNVMSDAQKRVLYALTSASLLRGIGQLGLDHRIELHADEASLVRLWSPLVESLWQAGRPYRQSFLKEGPKEERCRLTILLAHALMPKQGLIWIAEDHDLLRIWLALLDEDTEGAGTLGAILDFADAIAIQRYLSDFTHRIMGPHGAEGDGGGRAHSPKRMGTFSDTTPLSIKEQDKLTGAEFIQWLMTALESNKIMLNKPPLMSVPGGLILLPEVFQLFVREHPEYKNAKAAEKGFRSWGLHHVRQDGAIVFNRHNMVLTLSHLQAQMTKKLNTEGQWVSADKTPSHYFNLKPGASKRG